MSWYTKAAYEDWTRRDPDSKRRWGKIASGIMFRHDGKFLLQERSGQVEQGGVWGIPGGALEGTEGYFHVDRLVKPQLTPELMNRLYDSAMERELRQEMNMENGDHVEVSDQQKVQAIKNAQVDWTGNFAYVTFIVDLTEEQFNQMNEHMGSEQETSWEVGSGGHQWFDNQSLPENIHPGVKNVLHNISQVDVTQASFGSEVKTADAQWTQGQVFIEDDMQYDVEKLKTIVKDNKVTDIKVERLLKQLYDTSVWGYGNRRLSPMMVLNDPMFDHVVIKHMSKIRSSNLDKPIIIRSRDSKIIDGYHRVTKAFLIGKEKIKAFVVQEEQMDAAAIDLSSGEEYVPPADIESLRENYPKLIECPIHIWRANTGIELLHKEPDLKEFMRTLKNWEKMDDEMKEKSDKESIRLFGKDNLSRVSDILKEYEVE
jgi:ADP-ribose pyrophosphatase YjhB (NUDIX family)